MIGMISGLMKKKPMIRFMNYISKRHTSGCSMCYATAGLPFSTGKANVTFIDSGAAAWGGFGPDDMVIGLPGQLFSRIKDRIAYAHE